MAMTSETLSAMLRKLETAEPVAKSRKLAAVSVIIDGDDSPRTLLIKRAERPNDPWSGQVAFPGGKMIESDGSVRQTAIRETREELGVDLSRDADFAGYYVPFRTHTGDMEVVPVVFLLKREVKVVPNQEVSGYRWVGLDALLSARATSSYHLETGSASRDTPAYKIGDYVVWGLTQRIVSSLLG